MAPRYQESMTLDTVPRVNFAHTLCVQARARNEMRCNAMSELAAAELRVTHLTAPRPPVLVPATYVQHVT
ncbi:unnamed protein product, partial [Iphiclides podalirius]